jgi:tRNA nucleotidyltransferase (CCA-adding enzyme)
MARDADGTLIDPYGGRSDLDARILRHVSPAFAEDPLRVLRVARFAARLASHGFVVHESTIELMRGITAAGELGQLVPERAWAEIRDGLAAPRPSVFIDVLRTCDALKELLPEVDDLFGVPQPEKYHPEIDTGVHVMMALDHAAGQNWPAEVLFAVLVHDLGKGLTEQSLWPSHFDHERRGLPLVAEVCNRFRVPGSFRGLALKVCALHLRCHRIAEMRPGRMLALLEEADLLRHPDGLESLIRACEADFKGRKGNSDRAYPQKEVLEIALNAALGVRARQLETSGLDGPEIGEKLRQARIEAIAEKLRGSALITCG